MGPVQSNRVRAWDLQRQAPRPAAPQATRAALTDSPLSTPSDPAPYRPPIALYSAA